MRISEYLLITGCSDGGLGAALAVALHETGLHTMTLDVLSDSSIAASVKLSSLDILINNAGAGYTMPVSDISIPEAKKLFDLNVWSYLASKGMIANQTSVASVTTLPFSGAYSAPKAAMAMFSATQRLELAPFGITVPELKTGIRFESGVLSFAKDSIYDPAREIVEKALSQNEFKDKGMRVEEWAKGVARDIVKGKTSIIWRGEEAFLARIARSLPFGWFDGLVKRMMGFDLVEQIVKARG
ncbi:NAD(P)-binding protein [Acephala macrosclerotiorum]|nr:NAD(P)-binding protein [Acephala macrosclerotiorum]